jgi:hypothetical protein
LAAGNSTRQAQSVTGVLLLLLVVCVLKASADIFQTILILVAGLLFLSPNAFPWYFTWMVPFLCFRPSPPLLLLIVTSVLGYSPVIAYAAGGPFANLPLVLVLEYLPVYVFLGFEITRGFHRHQAGKAVISSGLSAN